MRRTLIAVLLVLTALCAAAAPVGAAQPSLSEDTVLTGAHVPLALTFAPDGRLFYAEKETGQIRVIENGALRDQPVADLGVVGGSEDGLLGLALDPAFEQNGRLYASYTSPRAGCSQPSASDGGLPILSHCIWRLTVGPSGVATPDKLIFATGHPSLAENHVSGGIHFGPDGKLYASLGDLGENDNTNGPERAQNLALPYGKLLRLDPGKLNTASDTAAGNPGTCGNVANTSQQSATDLRIYSCGLRNTYEFAFAANGTIWGSEAGDSCDEINRLGRAVNLGWGPTRTDCTGFGPGAPALPMGPPPWTPAGIDVWDQAVARDFRGDVLFCTNSHGGSLMRLEPASGTVTQLVGGDCLLDLTVSPSGQVVYADYSTIRRLTAPPLGAGPGAGPPPRITELLMEPRKLRVARKRRGRSAAAPSALVSYRLSKRATVTLTFERLRRGKARFAGRLAGPGLLGTGRLTFRGRVLAPRHGKVRRISLAPGTYRLTVRAKDAAGLSSDPRRLRFRMLRRPH